MLNKSKYKSWIIASLVIVAIAIVIVIAITGYKMYNSYYINKGALEAVKLFEETLNNDTSSKTTIKYKEFDVIGVIEIPNIELKYPILEQNSIKSLETSVVLMYTAQGLNNEGNSVIMGHNFNGTMFSNVNKLRIGNYIYITDTLGRKTKYEIYNIYEASDEDTSFITRNTEGKKEISLYTSSKKSKLRTIVLAEQV